MFMDRSLHKGSMKSLAAAASLTRIYAQRILHHRCSFVIIGRSTKDIYRRVTPQTQYKSVVVK
jgi:hypothetical protein